MAELIILKRCSACRDALPVSEFFRNKTKKDGYANQCKTCWKRTFKRYVEKQPLGWQRQRPRNTEADRAKSRHYAHRDKEKRREYYVRWCAENPEKRRRMVRNWRRRNPLKNRMSTQRRYWLKQNAKGSFTEEGFAAKCDYFGWRCYLCHIPLTLQTVTIEHRTPLSRGGTNWLANIAPACGSCNSKKGTKKESEYRA